MEMVINVKAKDPSWKLLIPVNNGNNGFITYIEPPIEIINPGRKWWQIWKPRTVIASLAIGGVKNEKKT